MVESLAERITWLIAQPKTLLGFQGMSDWRATDNYGEQRIAWPLAIGGQAPADLRLLIDAYPNDQPQKWAINLLFPSRIMGLDFDLEVTHNNARYLNGENLPFVIQGPHIHYWNDNKRFCRAEALPEHLHLAQHLPKSFRSFDTTFRWFCEQANVVLPSSTGLDLPIREKLL